MTVTKRTTYDEEGRVLEILEYDENIDYDKIIVRIHVDKINTDEPTFIDCLCYENDECVYQKRFQRRNINYTPISAIGRGETDKLEGVSSNMGNEDIPNDVQTSLQTVGFTLVPQGDWWQHE